jgi:hypothetical protein
MMKHLGISDTLSFQHILNPASLPMIVPQARGNMLLEMLAASASLGCIAP